MGMIPSIANVFGVSIDELFGYDNERSRKVDALPLPSTPPDTCATGSSI